MREAIDFLIHMIVEFIIGIVSVAAVLFLAAVAAALYMARPLETPFSEKVYRPPREPGLLGIFFQHFRYIWDPEKSAMEWALNVARDVWTKNDEEERKGSGGGGKQRFSAFECFITCIGRRIVLLDPHDLQYCLVSNASNFVKPKIPYANVEFFLGKRGLVTVRDEKLHHQLALIVRPTLNGKSLSYIIENYMPKHAATMCENLKRMFIDDPNVAAAGSDRIEDVYTDWTIGVTSEALFRTTEYKNKDGQIVSLGHEFVQLMDKGMKVFKYVFAPAALRDFAVKVIPSFRNMWNGINQHVNIIRNASVEMAQQAAKRGETEEVKSFVDVLAQHKEMMSDLELLSDTTMTIFSASLETTATSALHFTAHMALNPRAQEILYEELKESGALGLGVAPQYDDVKDLKYLQACIKESMRLTPAVAQVGRQVVTDDTLPSGLKLKAGTTIGCSVMLMQYHPKLWGPDVEQFRPERWLEPSIESLPMCAYMPFLVGPRRCLGEKMAYAELTVGLAAVMRRFKIEVAPGERHEMPKRRVAVTMRPSPMLKIVLKERSQ